MQMVRKLAAVLAVVLSLSVVLLPATPVGAAPSAASTPVGNDVSWPQCGKALPTTHAFGIVGVNGGLANNTNPCLTDELRWASRATGASAQAKVQLYVNTGNPGGLNTPSWPRSNVDPMGNTAPNPHGTCNGADTVACAWMYGWNRASEDVQVRFPAAAAAAGVSQDPSSYPWWLDVELENSWKTGGTAFDFQSNVADLEGMVAYFSEQGITVGVYSTGYQWGIIVGQLHPDSALNGLDSWLPGASNLKDATSNCSLRPLTPGSRVVLTQYVARGLDHDHSCIG